MSFESTASYTGMGCWDSLALGFMHFLLKQTPQVHPIINVIINVKRKVSTEDITAATLKFAGISAEYREIIPMWPASLSFQTIATCKLSLSCELKLHSALSPYPPDNDLK